jgi:hypothetical protein
MKWPRRYHEKYIVTIQIRCAEHLLGLGPKRVAVNENYFQLDPWNVIGRGVPVSVFS